MLASHCANCGNCGHIEKDCRKGKKDIKDKAAGSSGSNGSKNGGGQKEKHFGLDDETADDDNQSYATNFVSTARHSFHSGEMVKSTFSDHVLTPSIQRFLKGLFRRSLHFRSSTILSTYDWLEPSPECMTPFLIGK
jgi:hypothetical protein